MKYTREQIIKSIEALRSYCIDTRCEDCEFSVNNEKCKLDGLPANWCIPARHPSKKKIVPFNFSLEEDRKALKGRWIRQKEPHDDIEFMVDRFERNYFMAYLNDEFKLYGITGEDMLRDFVFSDTGKPVGKEVIE